MTTTLEHDKKYKDMELRVKEAEANMRKAAVYGQQLMSELSELKKSKEQSNQEVYAMKNRLDACSVLERASAEDIEVLKEANAKLMNDKDIAELQCSAKITKLLDGQREKELEYEATVLKLEESLKLRSEQLAEIQDRFNRSNEHQVDDSSLTTGNLKSKAISAISGTPSQNSCSPYPPRIKISGRGTKVGFESFTFVFYYSKQHHS